MTTSAPMPIRFGREAPTIAVTDIQRALAFYVDILGFGETFRNGDPVGFIIVKRDGAELHLARSSNHRATTQNVAHILVDDARRLYEQLISHDVRIVKGLRDAPYGIRGFVFADPDGNRIDAGQVL